MFKLYAFIIALLFASSCASADDGHSSLLDFKGTWQNTMGSELVFVVKDGLVSGRYNTNVGEPDKSKSFPLTGQAQGDQIVFTVNFKGFGSMTAWVGQVTTGVNGKPYLRTMWQNTKDIKDAEEKENIWGSIRTGASEFTKIETP